MKTAVLFVASFFLSNISQADQQNSDISEMGLEELMNVKVTVASKGSELSQRQAPSTVTVITAEDIKRNHARDLVDVFNMVPGFNISQDLGDTALTVRGLYGFEGRSLVTVDGMQLNGLYFGSYSFGNDFPIHMIDRIEIIRGPGSVLYGGFAELAVVNIITKKGGQLEGGEVVGRYGQMSRSLGHRDAGVSFGKKEGDWEYSGLVFVGDGRRSDGDYLATGHRPPIPHRNDSSFVGERAFASKISYKDKTKLKAYYQNYLMNLVNDFSASPGDDFDAIRETKTSPNQFKHYAIELSHEFNFEGGLTLVPIFSREYHLDWEFSKPNPHTEPQFERTKGQLISKWNSDRLEVLLGIEAMSDRASLYKDENDTTDRGFRKNKNDDLQPEITIGNYAALASASYSFDPFFVTAGLRYDKNDIYGEAVNPRFGVTYVSGDFHSKLLISQAFRAPTAGNNAYNAYGLDPAHTNRPDVVRPEKTRVVELESGYRFSPYLFGTVNLFYQKVEDVIQFDYDAGSGDLFSSNGGELGTHGMEAELKYIEGKYSGTFNFSFSKLGEAGAHSYLKKPNDDALLAVPEFKVYSNHSYNLGDGFSVQANLLYVGEKQAEVADGTNTAFGAQAIYGLGALWDEPSGNLSVAIDAHDISNQRLNIAVPYKGGGYDPFQYKGQEVSMSASYKF